MREKESTWMVIADKSRVEKRGNFGRFYPWSPTPLYYMHGVGHGTMGLKCVALYYMRGVGHGTMGLKCVSLYYMRGLGVGPRV